MYMLLYAAQGGFDWGGIGDFGRQTWQRTTTSTKSKQPQEEFYGFSDFFRDVEEEFSKRRSRGGREPGTLLEELAALGEGILEDFVEFLERELGIPPEEGIIAVADCISTYADCIKYCFCPAAWIRLLHAGSRSAAAAAAAAEHAGNGSRQASTNAAQAEQRANRQAVQAERTAAELSRSAVQKAENSEAAVDQMLADLKARLRREKGADTDVR